MEWQLHPIWKPPPFLPHPTTQGELNRPKRIKSKYPTSQQLQSVKSNLIVASTSEGLEVFAYGFDTKIPAGCQCCKICGGGAKRENPGGHRPLGNLSPWLQDPESFPQLHSYTLFLVHLPSKRLLPDHSLGLGSSRGLGVRLPRRLHQPLTLLGIYWAFGGSGSLKAEPAVCSHPYSTN